MAQGRVAADIADIGMEPQVHDFGGVGKRVELYRLPDRREGTEFTVDVAVGDLRAGDNPIYIRVVQEDGHMAWTSPVCVVVSS